MSTQLEHSVKAMAKKWAGEMARPNPHQQGTPAKRRNNTIRKGQGLPRYSGRYSNVTDTRP